MSRLSALLVLCFFISPQAGASQSPLTGVVVDRDTGQPLSKASVRIASSGEFILTNESGAFKIDVAKLVATDTLMVTHLGYAKLELPVSKHQPRLVIKLTREAMTLNEVTVFSEFWLKQYSPEELKEDYNTFCSKMEKAHTGLFDYLPEKSWQALKDSSLQLFQYPMSHSEFYRLIALHVGKVRNMHTRHGVTDWWYKRKTNIFPFNVRYFGNKLVVNESLVKGLSFPKGTEIIHINGRTPEQIKTMIWPFIPADGYNETGKWAALNDYFPWFFALFVEETESFSIKLKSSNGDETTIDTPGLKDAFGPLSFQQVQRWKKSALELQIDGTLKTAYFRIDDSRVFKDSLRVYFNRIIDNGVKHLIIDLRGGGGIREEEQVAELYSYLVNKPFRPYERLEIKSNDAGMFDKDFTFKPYVKSKKEIQKHFDKLVDSGKGYYLWQQESYMLTIAPADIQFTGSVYILADGRNYSASTDFTSLASQLDNVFIIGEETGGEYRAYISGAMYGLVLPNSKIGVKIPTWKSVLAVAENPAQRGRGVMPDFPVAQSLDDFVNGIDTVKLYAYELIRNKQ
jgi:hypothetical protein